MQPGSSWSSTILRKLGVTSAVVIQTRPELKARSVACLLTAALAMSSIPALAQTPPVAPAKASPEVSFPGNQPAPASIGRSGQLFYGAQTSSEVTRKLAYETMISNAAELPPSGKLKAVNRFFNDQILYQTDRAAWGKKDYWATPSETLAKGAGDCEDFAIAKYYALKDLGLDESKLKIVYVRSNQFKDPHMVLAVTGKPGGDPLILDNIAKNISTLSNRTDLTPVYAFNDSGLYMPNDDTLMAGPERLSKWQTVMTKVAGEQRSANLASNNDGKPLDVSMLSTGELKSSSDIGQHLRADLVSQKAPISPERTKVDRCEFGPSFGGC